MNFSFLRWQDPYLWGLGTKTYPPHPPKEVNKKHLVGELYLSFNYPAVMDHCMSFMIATGTWILFNPIINLRLWLLRKLYRLPAWFILVHLGFVWNFFWEGKGKEEGRGSDLSLVLYGICEWKGKDLDFGGMKFVNPTTFSSAVVDGRERKKSDFCWFYYIFICIFIFLTIGWYQMRVAINFLFLFIFISIVSLIFVSSMISKEPLVPMELILENTNVQFGLHK